MTPELTVQLPLPFADAEVQENAETTNAETEIPHAGITTPAANPPRNSILTLDEIKQMTVAEITARWAEVAAILSINN